MKPFHLIWTCSIVCVCAIMFSCVGIAPVKETHLIDSLNSSAYSYRYKNLDSSYHAALLAYDNVSVYYQGKAEACNNLAFYAFMKMDFEQAVKYHMEVYSLTKNEVELLIADIGLMKVYQRTALNKEFFDYRNSALKRLKRIGEDYNSFMDKHEKKRLNYARTEFYIVSAIYYYYLQQHTDAVACIDKVVGNQLLETDTNQLLYFHYIKGTISSVNSESEKENLLRNFDELYAVWSLASKNNYLYFEGNALQGLANLMADSLEYDFYATHRIAALQDLGFAVDSVLPMHLGQLALQKFQHYDDLYQIAGAYVTIGKYLNLHGRYRDALDTLGVALDCVNKHHRLAYNCQDSLDWLKMSDNVDAACVEQNWMQHKLKTVPEWILRIREQLSVAYAGLGMKTESDYNRNIYLDILEDIRQDKEQESRYQTLAKESRQLNVLLVLVAIGFILVLLFWFVFNKRSKEKNHIHLSRLQLMIDICQRIIAAIPVDANDETEIVDSIEHAVLPDLERLFGVKGICIVNRNLVFPCHVGKDEQAMIKVITPYIHYALDNGITAISLVEEQLLLEKQRYVYEQHIAGRKRQNIVKKSCVSIVNGIHPYIGRIINEVHKLADKRYLENASIKKEKYLYIDELVDKINEYNAILTSWVKMKQGSISLNIENFELNDLFNLIRKGSRAFEMKHLRLEVLPTEISVKADKALTLFMINTLAENARKYTPQGGYVKVYASQSLDYVEVSIEDSGIGLSAEDIACILEEKVYDSKNIGMHDAINQERLKTLKGSGFGLMNCKGIIEKYRKTNDFFKVCSFGIESVLGQGSRFYFRLPIGVKKTLSCLLFFLLGSLYSCADKQVGKQKEYVQPDSITEATWDNYELLLDSASIYADYAYYCNVDRRYNDALQYIDSAMYCLNTHYERYSDSPCIYMFLIGHGESAEISWWNEMFDTDYHIILDIRNEAAVAFLALKRWNEYNYNNAAYTTLYKLLGEDSSLEDDCNRLERSTNNKMVGIAIGVALLLALVLVYYFVYFRKRLVNRWNLEQVLEINQLVFTASQQPLSFNGKEGQEDNLLKRIPQKIVDGTFDAINELLGIDDLHIAVYNETTRALEYASASVTHSVLPEEFMLHCFTQSRNVRDGYMQAFPLQVRIKDVNCCIGVLCLKRREITDLNSDSLLLELITRYIAIVIFNGVVKLAAKYNDIEIAQDEAHRASWEDSVLHVQNMVLDNCLSAIKHETIYYPNRIKQLVKRLRSGELSAQEEKETIVAVSELIEYYNGIFTTLSRCASRQLEEVTFKRNNISVVLLLADAEKYFYKKVKGCTSRVLFEVKTVEGNVIGDINLLHYLLESLIDEALSCPLDGKLLLSAVTEDDFIRFVFTDYRRKKTIEELNQLFYPSLDRMFTTADGELMGTEYLICKQIVREHDEFSGRRGCRINAVSCTEGGYSIYFTIPKNIYGRRKI